jgi:hypothetical protein
MGCLVAVCESSPSADVVDENCLVPRLSRHYVLQQLSQRRPAFCSYSAPSRIRVSLYHLKPMSHRVFANGSLLIINRALLGFVRHPYVLCGGNQIRRGLIGGLHISHEQTLSRRLLIKRSMAAEYSRELGVKTLAGQKRIAALGFRVGGYAGYGLRRMLVTADRRPKELLRVGDRKSIATDRVVLVPGTAQEVACVRQIYQMVVDKRMSFVAIANELNRLGVPGPGSAGWTHYQVREIVTNPKYIGAVVYRRISKRLRTPEVNVSPDRWIVAHNAFEPVIAASTYHAAQAVLANRTMNKSNDQILDELRSILDKNGKLTSSLIRSTVGATPPGSYRRRFGSVCRAYAMIGYQMPNRRNVETRRRMQHIRLALLHDLQSLFPENIAIVSRKGHYRKQLLINGEPISVLACNCFRSQWGHIRWRIRTPKAENGRPLLLMLMNMENNDCQKMYLLPEITLPPAIDIASDSRILQMGEPLSSIEAFLELFNRPKGKRFDRAFSGPFLRGHA